MCDETRKTKNVVDLALAQAYVPICVSFLALCLVQFCVLVTQSDSMRSWIIILVVLQFFNFFIESSIFNSHAIFVTIANTGVLLQYEGVYRPTYDFRTAICFLWVFQFVIGNISLVLLDKKTQSVTVTKSLSAALCICLLISELFVNVKAESIVYNLIRPFFFYFGCIAWLYGTEAHSLRYDQPRDLHECTLRFSSLLVTPVVLSGLMTCLLTLVCITYTFKNNHDAQQEMGKKFDMPMLREDIIEDDTEMFRMAKSGIEQV